MKKLTEYASGNFLKAINVQSDKDEFLITEVEETKREGTDEDVLRLTLTNNGIEFEFDMNKTNTKFLVSKGFVEPLTLINKRLCFRKALVRNPKTNIEVEGLRICEIK